METDSHITYDSSTNNTWYSSWLYSLLSTNDKRGSLQLLSADCYSYLLLKRRKYLKETTLTISRSCIRVNSDKMEHLINLSRHKLTSNKSKYNPLDNIKECFNGWDFNASYVTRPRVTRHTFLEGISQINHWRCTEGIYRWVFYEFEDYVIKLFSIHPTLWSATRGAFLDDDGSVLNSCLNYIRFYESAMHLLSQKLHHHFYLTLFILIVLLRNVRRLLHHFKTNSAFFELILIMVEGIHLCQNHLYNTFMSDERIFRSPLHEKYEDHLSYEEMELKNIRKHMAVTQSLESIKSYNDGCNNYKTDICSICKDEKLKLELDSSREGSMAGDNNRATWSGESARDEELISLSVDSDLFGLYGTTCPRLTNRQDHFGSSLDYDNSEIFHLQYLNVVLDCEVSKWISELCKLATVYCKVGRGPVLLEKKYTKLVPDSKSSVIPGLCTPGFTNLSVHRSLKHRGAGLYKWKHRIQQRERKRHDSFIHRSKQNLHEEILSRIQSISESISKSLSQSQSLPQSSRSSLSHTPHKSTLLSQSHLHIRDQSPAEYISHSKQLLKRFEYTDDSSSSRSSADVTPVIKSVSLGKEPKTITPVKVKTKTSPRKKKKSGKSAEKPKKSKYQKWNLEEVQLFIKALNTYGDGKWRHIEKMYFLGKKSQAQLKDKWVNLVKFGHIKKVEIIRENGTIGRIWVPVESPSSNNI
ncbi:hypothetical protein MACJ_001310 [Theileria orientalis]|uniref:Uncharacterized protein n=1 Tax=Theileria orientalis TaxID=68886 RepID=A0A976M8B0_THEOR|nr:hypothetical protein MACJ_001310 [Theileria orientalis]